MGRRSSSTEKKAQIVAAFCDCAVDLGIEKASMGEVAARVGIDRSTMHYYFPAREGLVTEATQYIIRHYLERMSSAIAELDPRDRARSLIELLFGPTFHDVRRSTLLDELTALGNRSPFFLEQVKTVYKGIDAVIIKVFDESFPSAPERDRRTVAYVISQLAEGASVFVGLGFNKNRRLAARQVALGLLESLGDRAEVTSSPS